MPLLTEVDRLEVQVLVDNVTDSLSSTPPFVTREWPALVRQGMRRVAGAGLCCANHGLSLVIRAVAGEREHVVLFDTGPVDYAVEHNGTRLGIEFGAIEAVVLSHGHWDHGGGMLKAIELMRAAAPERRRRSICIRACSPSAASASRMAACCRWRCFRRRTIWRTPARDPRSPMPRRCLLDGMFYPERRDPAGDGV